MEGSLGMSVDEMLALCPQAADSEYYPGGACYEVETAVLRGTLVLTDEAEETVTGILSHRVDYFGILTGKTTYAQAEALIGASPAAVVPMNETAAEMYRVCPGTAAVYDMGTEGILTLYADENSVVQYVKLSLK